jgi:hypothetical protein
MDTGLTQTELEYIATVIAMDDAHRFSKKALLPLKKIKERDEGKVRPRMLLLHGEAQNMVQGLHQLV